jgi:hypothetical protein
VLPQHRLRRQDIVHAADGLNAQDLLPAVVTVRTGFNSPS